MTTAAAWSAPQRVDRGQDVFEIGHRAKRSRGQTGPGRLAPRAWPLRPVAISPRAVHAGTMRLRLRAADARRRPAPRRPADPADGVRRDRDRVPGRADGLPQLHRGDRRGRRASPPRTRHRPRASRSARATRAATSGRSRSRTTSASTRPSPRSCSTAGTTPTSTWRRDDPPDHALARRRLRPRHADHEHRQHARDLDRLRRQSRRRGVRHLRRQVPLLAQEPPADAGHHVDRHRSQPQLRLSLGRRRADQREPAAPSPTAGTNAFSTPEARAMRDFMASRVVDGRQQIRTAMHHSTRTAGW